MTQSASTTSYDVLTQSWQQLKAYREQPEFISDARDHSNFHGSWYDSRSQWLLDNEPTGLCSAALLLSMIDATIASIKVELKHLLFDAEFMQKASSVLAVRADLQQTFGNDITAFHNRVNDIISKVTLRSELPSLRAVSVCLRDALYSISEGLALRWVHCAGAEATPITLSSAVFQFTDTHSFLSYFRTQMPFGAHLVKVGEFTIIAFKSAERMAYLSSMKLNVHTGDFHQDGGQNSHRSNKALDFDNPIHRYPEWRATRRVSASSGSFTADDCIWGSVAELDNETLMWLVMVVEMANVRLLTTQPTPDQFVESVINALPPVVATERQLPVCTNPAWVADDLSIDDGLKSLEFTPWELAFFRESLHDLPWTFFLPEGSGMVDICLAERRVLTHEFRPFDRRIQFVAFNSSVVGTKAEVDTVRRTIFRRNLSEWVMKCADDRLKSLWNESIEFFKANATKNLNALAALPFGRVVEIELFPNGNSAHIYKQDPKRKTYTPLCMFDGKSKATHVLVLAPDDSAQIAQMLGMNEAELPEWLIGWKRDTGTWTSDPEKTVRFMTEKNFNLPRWKQFKNHVFTVSVSTTL